jgi:hypothetical protein
MRTTFFRSALLVGALTLGGTMVRAQEQQPPAPKMQWSSTDLAMTYTTEATKVTPGDSGNFWLQGGSLDGGVTFFRGFGWAGNLTIDHASKIAPGFSLTERDVLTGPRYTFRRGSKRESRFFIEALAGVARASDDLFPTSRGATDKANAFIWQAGGGWDLNLSTHIAIRLFEADYVRSYLPNNGENTQAHLRLAIGVAYHIKGH